MVDARTRFVALLGDPVAQSLSPLIHNTALREQGFNWLYVALRVRRDELPAAVLGLPALGFMGANVTIPHKETVLGLMDALSPQAQAVGAVNTIVVRRPHDDAPATLYGDNTDVVGFLEQLLPHADVLRGAEMTVLGAGGAARAVIYALLSTFRPTRLTLVARRPEQAEAVAEALQAHDAKGALGVTTFEAARLFVRTSRLIVNATPLGMYPGTDVTPWEEVADFSAGQIAYDLVYHPVQTRFLREAAAHGVAAIDGLGMLVGQAVAAYIQWTGQRLPTETVYAALQMHVNKRS